MIIRTGSVWRNKRGSWLKVEYKDDYTVHFNTSDGVQWLGGRCQTSLKKFKEILERGGYTNGQSKENKNKH